MPITLTRQQEREITGEDLPYREPALPVEPPDAALAAKGETDQEWTVEEFYRQAQLQEPKQTFTVDEFYRQAGLDKPGLTVAQFYEQEFGPAKEPGGIRKQLGIGIGMGFAGEAKAVNKLYELVAHYVPSWAPIGPMGPLIPKSIQERILSKVGLLPGGSFEEQARGASEISARLEQQVEELGQQTEGPGLARRLAASVVASSPAAIAAPAGMAVASITAGAQQFAGTMADAEAEYLRQGYTVDQARRRALPVAVGSGLITGLVTRGFGATGIEGIQRAIASGEFRAILKDVLFDAGMEAGEETIDQIGQGILSKLTYQPGMTWTDVVMQSLEAGLAGGVMGGGMKTMQAAGIRRMPGETPGMARETRTLPGDIRNLAEIDGQPNQFARPEAGETVPGFEEAHPTPAGVLARPSPGQMQAAPAPAPAAPAPAAEVMTPERMAELQAAKEARERAEKQAAEAEEDRYRRAAMARAGQVRALNRETEAGHEDVIAWLAGGNQVMSRSQAEQTMGERFKENKSEWDEQPERLQAPHHNLIYGGRELPNTVAQRAFEAGKITDPTATALWEAVDAASRQRREARGIQAREQAELKRLEAEALAKSKRRQASAIWNPAILTQLITEAESLPELGEILADDRAAAILAEADEPGQAKLLEAAKTRETEIKARQGKWTQDAIQAEAKHALPGTVIEVADEAQVAELGTVEGGEPDVAFSLGEPETLRGGLIEQMERARAALAKAERDLAYWQRVRNEPETKRDPKIFGWVDAQIEESKFYVQQAEHEIEAIRWAEDDQARARRPAIQAVPGTEARAEQLQLLERPVQAVPAGRAEPAGQTGAPAAPVAAEPSPEELLEALYARREGRRGRKHPLDAWQWAEMRDIEKGLAPQKKQAAEAAYQWFNDQLGRLRERMPMHRTGLPDWKRAQAADLERFWMLVRGAEQAKQQYHKWDMLEKYGDGVRWSRRRRRVEGLRQRTKEGKRQILLFSDELQSPEHARQVVREEIAHDIFAHDAIQQMLDELAPQYLTGDVLSGLKEAGYPVERMSPAALLDEYFAKANRERLPAWKQIIEHARVWLKQRFPKLINLSDAEIGRALRRRVRQLRVREEARAETPVPERPETLAAQLAWVRTAKRPAILITPGEAAPAGSEDLSRVQVDQGLVLYDPRQVTEADVRRAAQEDRLGDLLGYGVARRPTGGTEAVVVRGPDGVEKQAVEVDEAGKEAALARARELADEGDTVAVEPRERVVEDRLGAPGETPGAARETRAVPGGEGTRYSLGAEEAEGAPGETPGATRETRAVPPETQERKLAGRLEAMTWLSKEAQAKITNRTYEVASMKGTEAAAADLLAQMGTDAAAQACFDFDLRIPEAVRAALTYLVAKEYARAETTASPKDKEQWRQKQADFFNRLLPITTQYGQYINFLKAFTWQTPEGVVYTAQKILADAGERHLRTYQRMLTEAKAALAAEHRAATHATLATPAVQTAARAAVDEAVAADLEIVREIRKQAMADLRAEPALIDWIRQLGLPAAQALQIIEEHYGSMPLPKPAEVGAGTRYALGTQAPAAAAPAAAPLTLAEKLIAAGASRNAAAKFAQQMDARYKAAVGEQYKSMLGQIKAARQKKAPAAKAKAPAAPQAPRAGPETLIRRKLRDWQMKLSQAVDQYEAGGMARKLSDAIVTDTKLTGPAADKLKAAIETKFNELATQRKAAALEKLISGQAPSRATSKIRTALKHFIQVSNAGGLDDAKYWQAIQEQFGLRQLSAKEAAKLRDLAERMQVIPEDQAFRRQEAGMALMRELERLRPLHWWEWPMAFWYTHVLAGAAHVVNISNNVMNFAGTLGAQTVHNPGSLPVVLPAVARGAKKGLAEALAALQTGAVTGERLGQKFGDPGIWDRVDSRWLLPWKLAANRSLAAEDLLFFYPASEMRQALLALEVAKREGLTGAARRRRTAEIMGNTNEIRSAAGVQATNEGFKGRDRTRRINEIVQQRRQQFGNFAETGREFALRTTFNNRPYGILGMAADLANTMNARTVFSRFLVPFTNIIANATNECLNYTPIGSVRALIARRTGRAYGKDLDLTDYADKQTLADLHAKAAIGSLLLLAATLRALREREKPRELRRFDITGQGPRDQDRRQTLRETGWRPNSVKLGDTYVSYLATPMVVPLAVIGNILDAREHGHFNEGTLLDRATYGVTMFGKSMIQQSFLDGLARLVGAIEQPAERKGGEALLSWTTRTGSSFVVPSAVRQVDRIFNPDVYDEPGMRGAVLSQLPFVRKQLRPVLNGLGEPIERSFGDRWFGRDQPDPVWRLMAQLNVALYPRQLTWLGEPMSEDQVYEVVKLAGPKIRKHVERLMPKLEATRPEIAKQIVERVVEAERELAKAKVIQASRAAQ